MRTKLHRAIIARLVLVTLALLVVGVALVTLEGPTALAVAGAALVFGIVPVVSSTVRPVRARATARALRTPAV